MVRVVPVASPVASPMHVKASARRLEAHGFRVELDERLWGRDGYFAGSPKDRAAAFVEAFKDPDVDVVMAAAGGFGSAGLLDVLHPDDLYGLDKWFVGYSDVTCLHLWLTRIARLRGCLYGPTLTHLAKATDVTFATLEAALSGETYVLMRSEDGMTVEQIVGGAAEGPLTGGCLSLLQASLGTPWEIHTEGAIVFLEDVGEEPYRVHRMLMQLRQAGKWARVRGIIVGEMVDCRPARYEPSFPFGTWGLEEVLARELGDLGVPVVYGYPIGHGHHLETLPYGALCRIDDGTVTVRS